MIMNKEDIEKAAKEAIKEHYNCNGKYPCSERSYCIFCDGKNTAYDCNECGADEFYEGFITGAKWRIKSIWHNDMKKVETQKPILVLFKNGLFNLFEDIRELKELENDVEMFAYLNDLITDNKD